MNVGGGAGLGRGSAAGRETETGIGIGIGVMEEEGVEIGETGGEGEWCVCVRA